MNKKTIFIALAVYAFAFIVPPRDVLAKIRG